MELLFPTISFSVYLDHKNDKINLTVNKIDNVLHGKRIPRYDFLKLSYMSMAVIRVLDGSMKIFSLLQSTNNVNNFCSLLRSEVLT